MSDLTRRSFLRGTVPVAGAVAVGLASGRWIWGERDEGTVHGVYGQEAGAHADHGTLETDGEGGYGHGPRPPDELGERALDAVTIPPPPGDASAGSRRRRDLSVSQQRIEVAAGHHLDAWTFGGSLPGPILRATEGDRLELTVENRTSLSHNLHLHGAHDPTEDGWEPIPAGGSATYELDAAPSGLHPYHCHTPPTDEHVARGLYGALIVDPPEPRPQAHEFVLVLGGFDLDGDGHNEAYGWNGVTGFYDRYPLKVPIGELVRCYLVNMVEYDPIASFHLHAETFDLYRSGTSQEPDERTDTVTLGQGERAIVEFRLPHRGRYMFHPHQSRMAAGGATGWFAAV